MTRLLTVGEMASANAHLYPDRIGARDFTRSMTFRQWNERSCRLANSLLGLGLRKGDRVAILAYNCVEWLEIYVATAKAGLVAVPINFRLIGVEIRYIIQDAGAAALIVQEDLVERIEEVRSDLPGLKSNHILLAGASRPGYTAYEEFLAGGAPDEPIEPVRPEDPWAILYTSGTTGHPKGAIRSHQGAALLSLVTDFDFGFTRNDSALLVMPMCHANSLYFFAAFAYCGASCCVYDRKSLDPEHLLLTLAEEGLTFTSLVPTHYIMMLGLPDAIKQKYNVDRVTRLLISSASARRDTKEGITEYFRNSQLFELYGSTEAGWVTILRPDEQLTRLGSVGREFTGSARIRLLSDDGREVPEGQVGELYSRTPYTFDGYWNLPEKTAQAFQGEYCTVGDMARREAGYYYLVDRKLNMIITGGENVYPSEVENILGSHHCVKDVAVIGLPDSKWGESVHAVVVLRDGMTTTEAELIAWSKDRMAGYKRPKSIAFISEERMPRTATGKILHRALRARYGEGAQAGQ